MNINFPFAIVFHEKHGDRYFLATDTESVYSIFTQIFKERLEAGYWYISRKPEEPKKPQPPKNIHDPSEASKYGNAMSSYQRKLNEYKRELDEFNLIEYIKKTMDPQKIHAFMTSRKDGEYEGFDYETFENYR